MKRVKFVEGNIPSSLRVQVRYLTPNHIEGLPSGIKRITIARLFDKVTGQVVAQHASSCHANDNDNKTIGRHIAVGRAFKEYYSNVVEK